MRDNVIPKFRAFLIEDKTMRDVVEIDFVKNMYCLQIGRSTIGEWFWYRDLFLMQSTGLKDKNGVEIFEYNELDGAYEVIFKDLKYSLRHISNNDIIGLQDYWRDKNGEIEVTREYTKV